MKVSAGEGEAFIGVVDKYTENKPGHSLITKNDVVVSRGK